MDLDESVYLTKLTPVILEFSDGQQTVVNLWWHALPVTVQLLSSVTEEDTRPLQHCNVNVESV